ncbi:MAG TPA: DUF177 domain-containing protein [Candidatus Binatia bacterium]
MKLRVDRITDEATQCVFQASVEELNQRLEDAGAHDFSLASPLEVDVTYYRAGDDLYFEGHCSTVAEGTCARCLETFSLPLATPFEFVLTKALPHEVKQELKTEDLALSFYSGDEIDLTPLVGEQAILALPTRAVCREDCRGLCPACGTNRNTDPCTCSPASPDPRFAVLSRVRVRTEP